MMARRNLFVTGRYQLTKGTMAELALTYFCTDMMDGFTVGQSN